MPDWSNEIRERLAGLKVDPAREQSIVEEIAQHLDDRYAELLAQGSAPETALRSALDELPELIERAGLDVPFPPCLRPLFILLVSFRRHVPPPGRGPRNSRASAIPARKP